MHVRLFVYDANARGVCGRCNVSEAVVDRVLFLHRSSLHIHSRKRRVYSPQDFFHLAHVKGTLQHACVTTDLGGSWCSFASCRIWGTCGVSLADSDRMFIFSVE